MTDDHKQARLTLDRPGMRIEGLGEVVTVLEACFGDGGI